MADYLIHAPDGTPPSSFGGTLSGSDTLTVAQRALLGTPDGPVAVTFDLAPAPVGFAGGVLIDNSGTIQANSSVIVSAGTSTAARNLTVLNETTGTIVANGPGTTLALGSETDTVMNYGALQASTTGTAVSLGAGNDELDLYTGSTTQGLLDGGAGSDTVNLSLGAPSRTGILADVSNFEMLNVNAGTWTVTDSQSYVGGIAIGNVASLTLGQVLATPLIAATTGTLIGAIADAGTLTIAQTGSLTLNNSISGAGGVMQSGSGTTTLAGTNSFSGGATLTAGTLEIASPGAAGSFDIAFAGKATLALDGTVLPANRIDGFTAGDSINLHGLAYNTSDSVSVSGSVVTLGVDGTSYILDITGVGALGLSSAADGSLVLSQAPCYVAGTGIATPKGERQVEDLQAGDVVILATGGTAPIVWVGHRRVRNADPVRIVSGAFGPGLPARDLVLSPEHALFLNGHLVPAHVLVDATSVIQEAWASVTYYHVELDRHGVLLAEGLPAESYLDTGNRTAFANGALVNLHADFGCGDKPAAAACAPLALDGPVVEAQRALLAAVALNQGRVAA
ncbi:MAG: Hint domain-containing protein [Janthinobacterium lividum]